MPMDSVTQQNNQNPVEVDAPLNPADAAEALQIAKAKIEEALPALAEASQMIDAIQIDAQGDFELEYGSYVSSAPERFSEIVLQIERDVLAFQKIAQEQGGDKTATPADPSAMPA